MQTAIEVLNEMKENLSENGDYYFLYAKIQELKGDLKGYRNCLNLALKNDTSLSFNKYAIMKELKECPITEETQQAQEEAEEEIQTNISLQ